ncbi:hypothetical protein BDQ12DRAFT_383209 [Crucibulum laeve]|uniref:Uncharacterized protein n=1 Tax=Crucibulum laeve TaxID=68775 RepID=A0A5C3LMR8_9AGAR|nr:hypothetical protein BDQ12DRAFT_383209 [Crucibulum laeve]
MPLYSRNAQLACVLLSLSLVISFVYPSLPHLSLYMTSKYEIAFLLGFFSSFPSMLFDLFLLSLILIQGRNTTQQNAVQEPHNRTSEILASATPFVFYILFFWTITLALMIEWIFPKPLSEKREVVLASLVFFLLAAIHEVVLIKFYVLCTYAQRSLAAARAINEMPEGSIDAETPGDSAVMLYRDEPQPDMPEPQSQTGALTQPGVLVDTQV